MMKSNNKANIALWIYYVISSLYHCPTTSFLQPLSSSSSSSSSIRSRSHAITALLSRSSVTAKEEEEDWRTFRAKLVHNNNETTTNSWTFDTGLLIEKGSIVLSRVEDSLGCHDLRQPYFCKCVVLVVEHGDDFTTQGIILNRPSNLNLNDQDIVYFDDDGVQIFPPPNDDDDDDDRGGETDNNNNNNNNNSWRMFYGGDIAGLYDDNPLIVCLHNHTSDLAQSVSDTVLPGVYITSHLGARTLVDSGLPAESFYTFYGFCGWDPGQLEREVKRGSWYMVSVDSQTLWKELKDLREETSDPRMVGLDMWEGIVNAIGRYDELKESNEFADLMLKEWATRMLMVSKDDEDTDDLMTADIDDSDIYRALQAAGQSSLIKAGTLVRASSSLLLDESPFLLQDQFLHKSIVLILQENDDVSIGLVLNLPSTESYTIQLPSGGTATFPIRYGGPGGNSDEEDPLIWLHSNERLRNKNVGKSLNEDDFGGIWTCSLESVIDSMESSMATSDDFILVQGFCVWEKERGSGGIVGEIMEGRFEQIPAQSTHAVWSQLLDQDLLSNESLETNFQIALQAWEAGGVNTSKLVTISRTVFDSNVSVSVLSDEALLAWIKIFLLGNAEYYI